MVMAPTAGLLALRAQLRDEPTAVTWVAGGPALVPALAPAHGVGMFSGGLVVIKDISRGERSTVSADLEETEGVTQRTFKVQGVRGWGGKPGQGGEGKGSKEV